MDVERLVIETDYYTRPVSPDDPPPVVPTRQPGETPKEARCRRVPQLAASRRLQQASRLGGQRVAYWDLAGTQLSIHGQGDAVNIPHSWQHACCAPPDEAGRVYPVCGMSAMECAGYDWF